MTNRARAEVFRRDVYKLAARASRHCDRYPDFAVQWATIAAALAEVDRTVGQMIPNVPKRRSLPAGVTR